MLLVRLYWSLAVRTAAVVERLATPSVVSELEVSMEKQQEAQPDSLSTVTVKEYPPSEVYSSEPPPAYQKPRSTAVQIARIAAVTVVLVSFVLGGFILAAAWIEASASCHQLAQLQALAMAQDEAAAVESHEDQPVFQHLVDNKAENNIGNEDENKQDDKEVSRQQPQPQTQQPETEQTVSQDHTPIQIRLPLQLDFDDLAGAMMEKNQRSRMNCVVEKRRAEEIVDHQPHTVRLPFGVNLTTDPRYEHISGEKMAIYCESGRDQRHMPMEMMATPIVVPLPGPVHLPLQFHGPMQQTHQNRIPIPVNRATQPAVGLVPPPPNHVQQVPLPVVLPMQNMQPHPSQVHAAIQMTETREDQLPSQLQYPSQAETQDARVMHHIPVQVEAREGRTLQQVPVQVTTRDGRAFSHLPLPIHVETHKVRAFAHPPVPIQVETHEGQTFHPVQVEGHESRAFQHQNIPVHAYMGESQAFNPEAAAAAAAAAMHAAEGRVFHQQSPASEMVNQQHLTGDVPVPMMHQIQVEGQLQPRPHYVQPRSVRSVDEVLHRRDKRVRRCACDCAC